MIPVIIPTYRGEFRLPRVLECVARQKVATEIFIRDNNVNGIYYTRAINEGLKKFAFEPGIKYCLILCDDVYLHDDCLRSLIAFADSNPRAGIVSPIQVSEKTGRIIWSASLHSWPSGRHVTGCISDEPYPNNWPSGACFLARTEMIKEIGLLDPNMLFVCSDSDYGLTARSRGWEVWVEPRARVFHEFAGSQNLDDIPLNVLKTKDTIYFTQKWLSGDLFREIEYEGEKLPKDLTEEVMRVSLQYVKENDETRI